MDIIVDKAIATRPGTIAGLGWAALAAYAVGVLCFGIGLVAERDALREIGLGFGIIGIVLDLRHYTGRAIARLIQTMSLWQDGDVPDPQHRRAATAPPLSESG